MTHARLFWIEVVLLLAVLYLCSCGGSSDDPTEPSPQTVCFDLQVVATDACGLKISMLIAPSCSATDSSFARSFQVRHDFDNDGEWDTGYWSLDTHPIFDQIMLPTDVWLVRSEVQRADGSTFLVESSLDLPDWLPSPPDIVAAQCGFSDAPVETLVVGESWTFHQRAVHWMNSSPGPAIIRYFVDDVVVGETYVGFDNPLEPGCHFFGVNHPGFLEEGTHELKVVWDAENSFAETNEDNNEMTKSLVVVAE